MTPLYERTGFVGNIESIRVDGRRYYFGHDAINGRVLSPLFDKPAEMAMFASRFMLRSDGHHSASDWMRWVRAVDSGVTHWPGNLDIDTAALCVIQPYLQGLRTMEYFDISPSSVDLPMDAIRLLQAVSDAHGDGRLDAMFTLADEDVVERYGDALSWALEVVADPRSVPVGLKRADMAEAIAAYIRRMVSGVPANWKLAFGELLSADDTPGSAVHERRREPAEWKLRADCPYQVKRYADVVDEVPEDCDNYWQEPEEVTQVEEWVLYVDGDLRLGRLDLDDPLAAWRADDATCDSIWFILVTGSVFVEGHLWNQDTDGACGLVVLGNLHAADAVVGGQQIYVGGNLDIDALYWGHYNHGSLHVAGDTRALVLIQTDYHMDLLGQVACFKRLDDDAIDAFDEDELGRIVDARCVMRDPDAGFGVALDRERVIELLGEGVQVVQRERLEAPEPEFAVPSLFADATVSPQHFLRLAADNLMPWENEEATRRYDFDREDLSLMVMRVPGDTPDDTAYSVVIQYQGGGPAACFTSSRGHMPRTWKQALSFQTPEQGWVLGKEICDDAGAERPNWRVVEGNEFPAVHTAMVLKGWKFLLEGASFRHWASEQIAPQEVRALLALPLATPYDDYESDERNGLWVGNLHAAFRHETAGENGVSPILRFSRPCIDTDGDFHLESFFYDVERCLDGRERVRIRYKADQNDDDSDPMPLDLIGGQRLATAIRVFRRGELRLQQANAELLDGHPPLTAVDDGFAMSYWKRRGYLSKRKERE